MRRGRHVTAVTLRSFQFAAILIVMRMQNPIGWVCCALLLSACGGGDSGNVAPAGWQAGLFQPESSFAARCAAPRAGADPITGRAYPDRPGNTLDENNWLRSWTHDLYLWFDEVRD
ncbi:MAG TPA: hypothetical protein VGN77_08745, partial [Steroidobacteraceae bacterium]|nr:hypothetical protein [Steroidobacteraceae bacterium]